MFGISAALISVSCSAEEPVCAAENRRRSTQRLNFQQRVPLLGWDESVSFSSVRLPRSTEFPLLPVLSPSAEALPYAEQQRKRPLLNAIPPADQCGPLGAGQGEALLPGRHCLCWPPLPPPLPPPPLLLLLLLLLLPFTVITAAGDVKPGAGRDTQPLAHVSDCTPRSRRGREPGRWCRPASAPSPTPAAGKVCGHITH